MSDYNPVTNIVDGFEVTDDMDFVSGAISRFEIMSLVRARPTSG